MNNLNEALHKRPILNQKKKTVVPFMIVAYTSAVLSQNMKCSEFKSCKAMLNLYIITLACKWLN